MNFISKLFKKQKIDCPRCLGKGEVDWDDIKRLEKELKWIPGKCAYCNGLGKVSTEMASRVSVDNTYLTTNISQEERKRLINRDDQATQRANLFETQVNDFILQIEYLHFIGNLEPPKIADFYLIPKTESEVSFTERKELLEYVERVIENKKRK